MPGEHQHCSCNGVWLCRTCHAWVHAHPFDARGTGFIVSRHTDPPGQEPVVAAFGQLLLGCDGRFQYWIEEQAQ